MDHCGLLSWAVDDAATSLQAIVGFDPLDPASADVTVDDFSAACNVGVRALKIADASDWLDEDPDTDPEIRNPLRMTLDTLRAEGAEIEPVSLPSQELFHACGRLIVFADSYAIHEKDLLERPGLYGQSTRERLMAGAFVRGSDYVEALRLRRELALQFSAAIFGKFDALIAPTTALAARRFDSEPINPLSLMGLTMPFNVTGNPAMAVCCGFTSDGLPISLQVVGRPFDEAMVFRIGAAYERASDWRLCRPRIAAED